MIGLGIYLFVSYSFGIGVYNQNSDKRQFSEFLIGIVFAPLTMPYVIGLQLDKFIK